MIEKLPKGDGKTTDFHKWRNLGTRIEMSRKGMQMREVILADINKEVESAEAAIAKFAARVLDNREQENSPHVMEERVILEQRRTNAIRSRDQVQMELEALKKGQEAMLREDTPEKPRN